jgi:hypothetical protein
MGESDFVMADVLKQQYEFKCCSPPKKVVFSISGLKIQAYCMEYRLTAYYKYYKLLADILRQLITPSRL